MSLYWSREIDNLKKLILSLGALVEEQIQKSIVSLLRRDAELANEVIEKDSEVDNLEIKIEEECLKILALYQPVAQELRFVVTVLKMNNDLERMGDLAVNIAHRSVALADKDRIELISAFQTLAEKTQKMVSRSLDALINTNVKIAKEVMEADDEIDRLNFEFRKKAIEGIKSNPARLEDYLHLRTVSQNLERIADQATNIAEDVVYLCTGEIIRHHATEFNP
jgi:phosphate transport system protein